MKLFYKLCTIVSTQSAVYTLYLVFCKVNNKHFRKKSILVGWCLLGQTIVSWTAQSLNFFLSDFWTSYLLWLRSSPLKKQRQPSHAVSSDWNPLVESSEALEKGSILGSQQQENSTWSITHLNSTSIQIWLHITQASPYTFKRQHSTWEVDVRNFALWSNKFTLFGEVNLTYGCGPLLPVRMCIEIP